MAAEPAPALDMDGAFAFAFKVLGDFIAVEMGTLITIGDRLGLYDALAAAGPSTCESFAQGAGPWVMWAGTPYEHIMMPVADGEHEGHET